MTVSCTIFGNQRVTYLENVFASYPIDYDMTRPTCMGMKAQAVRTSKQLETLRMFVEYSGRDHDTECCLILTTRCDI